MADAYTFIGYAPRIYLRYVDLATEKTLIAEPGNTYEMRPVELDMPVPPDGAWQPAVSKTKASKAADRQASTEKGE